MRELSLNILDVAQNSVNADAKNITISVIVLDDLLEISIKDDGKGMSKEYLAKVSDPFTTTRTTRNVGMGIPLFKSAAEASGGKFVITSSLGKGTTTKATFGLSSIDRMPLGDIAGTITILIMGKPEIDFVLDYRVNQKSYIFDTKQVKNILDGVPIENAEIISYIEGIINDNILKVNGGTVL